MEKKIKILYHWILSRNVSKMDNTQPPDTYYLLREFGAKLNPIGFNYSNSSIKSKIHTADIIVIDCCSYIPSPKTRQADFRSIAMDLNLKINDFLSEKRYSTVIILRHPLIEIEKNISRESSYDIYDAECKLFFTPINTDLLKKEFHDAIKFHRRQKSIMEKTELGGNQIKREIEFQPEHYAAGMTILSHFSRYIQNKYSEDKIQVQISVEIPKVIMTIKTETGETIKTIIKELKAYTRVVRDEITPEEFIGNENSYDLKDFRLALDHSKYQLETQALLEETNLHVKEIKQLLIVKDKQDQTHRKIDSLSDKFAIAFTKAVQDSPPIKIVNNIRTEANATQTQTVNMEIDKSWLRLISEIEQEIERAKHDPKLSKIDIEKLERHKNFFEGCINSKTFNVKFLRDNLDSLNVICQGAAGSMLATALMPKVTELTLKLFNYMQF